MGYNCNATPFLRWAGGKRWLSKKLAPLLSERLEHNNIYFEPFLGSGAMFFEINPKNAILSDLNKDLIITFNSVSTRIEDIIHKLRKIQPTETSYYALRTKRPRTNTNKAVRFIFLNRNCYGGLYRENKKGRFNVPFGGSDRNHFNICDNGTLRDASEQLKNNVAIVACDFSETISQACGGDIIYCDPTYRKVNRQSFDRYGKNIFDWNDQIRLSKLALEAYNRNALVIISNASCMGIRRLYPNAAMIELIRNKGIGPQSNKVNQVEYLFILDPLENWSDWSKIGNLILPKKRKLTKLRFTSIA